MSGILMLGDYAEEFARQIPLSMKNTQLYTFNTVDSENVYDLLVVFEALKLPISARFKRSIFISGEPEAVRSYNGKFVNQFDLVLSTNASIKYKNALHEQYLPWHIGLFEDREKYTYDYFTRTEFDNKTKNIAAITSTKAISKGHLDRMEFIRCCKEEFKESLDVYGRGLVGFNDKIDILPSYKYQIVIENSSIPDYWTEKLADSFLANCYTFYYGCPNIKKYFPEDSYTEIDITKPRDSLDKISEVVEANEFERRREEIRTSRSKILNQYNLMLRLPDLIGVRRARRKRLMPEQFVARESFFGKLLTYSRGRVMSHERISE